MLMLIYFLLAVGVSFLCSILEAVLLSVTSTYIESIKKDNYGGAKLLEEQKKDIDRSIASILTLNTFAHTLGAAGVGAEAVKIFGDEYMFYISFILTIMILIFSEIIPKTIGAYYWRELSLFSGRAIYILVKVTSPLLYIMKKITDMITPEKGSIKSITKDEIYASASMGQTAGIIREKDTGVIENLLKLDSVKVKDIHTPRSVMFSISSQDILESLSSSDLSKLDVDKLREYSRVPIYGEDIDDIKGVILTKEFFHEFISNQLESKDSIIKPIFKIHEHIPVSKLLDIFISKKEHMFIVVDSYGQTQGIVTLEDAVETLLGVEIVDEFDKNIDMRALAKTKLDDCPNILY